MAVHCHCKIFTQSYKVTMNFDPSHGLPTTIEVQLEEPQSIQEVTNSTVANVSTAPIGAIIPLAVITLQLCCEGQSMGINDVLDEVRLLVMNCACISLIANQTSTMAMCWDTQVHPPAKCHGDIPGEHINQNAMVTCWNIQVQYSPAIQTASSMTKL